MNAAEQAAEVAAAAAELVGQSVLIVTTGGEVVAAKVVKVLGKRIDLKVGSAAQTLKNGPNSAFDIFDITPARGAA